MKFIPTVENLDKYLTIANTILSFLIFKIKGKFRENKIKQFMSFYIILIINISIISNYNIENKMFIAMQILTCINLLVFMHVKEIPYRKRIM